MVFQTSLHRIASIFLLLQVGKSLHTFYLLLKEKKCPPLFVFFFVTFVYFPFNSILSFHSIHTIIEIYQNYPF